MAGLARGCGQVFTAARRIRGEIMQKSHSKKTGNGLQRPKRLKLSLRERGKNGYIHVTRAGTVSEIHRTLGIKPSHVRNMLRAFKAAGVEV
jgi:hypothetical protein